MMVASSLRLIKNNIEKDIRVDIFFYLVGYSNCATVQSLMTS